MIEAAEIEAALAPVLRDIGKDRLDQLTATVAEVANEVNAGRMTSEEAHKRLTDFEVELQPMGRGGAALIDFTGAQVDSVSLGDVAGRDVNKQTYVVIQIGNVPIRIGERTPLHEIERRLVAIMADRVDEAGLQDAAEALGIDLSKVSIDRRWFLARGLLRTDLTRLVEAARRLVAYLCDDTIEMIDLAAPFCWLGEHVALGVMEAMRQPAGQRGVGINSMLAETGQMCILRACSEYPQWRPQQVEGGWSDLPVSDLLKRAESAIRFALGYEETDEVTETELQQELDQTHVFVILPPPLDAAMLAPVRQRFPQVTFLLLAGDLEPEEFDALKLPFVNYLLPPLIPMHEHEALRSCSRARRTIKGACAHGGRR